jgi:5-methylcytosine-specific restriction endonuclease McrA
MPAKMRKFLARPPRRLTEEAVSARANKCVRRGGRPKGWLEECCESQNWRCAYCGRSMRRKARKDKPWLTATLDHVLPVSRGGRNQRANLVAACLGCNQSKGALTADEFRALALPDYSS